MVRVNLLHIHACMVVTDLFNCLSLPDFIAVSSRQTVCIKAKANFVFSDWMCDVINTIAERRFQLVENQLLRSFHSLRTHCLGYSELQLRILRTE